MRLELRLQGPRLTLTALSAEELEQIRCAPEDEDARAYFVERLRDDPDALGWWSWLAELQDGEQVGGGGFFGRPGPDRRLTVGYGIHEQHRCRGYATEVLTLLTDWALAGPDVDVVRATITPDNVASIRVAEKVGFTASGERVHNDEDGELIVFERRRRES